MKTPDYLKGEARKFFLRHCKRCEKDGTLTDATLDGFILLCRTWGMLTALDTEDDKMGIIKYVALSKIFERQGVPFGITAKKRVDKKKDIATIIKEGLAAS